MSDLGQHVNDWGNNSEIYSLIISVLTFLATSLVGFIAWRIAKYQSKQTDRLVIQDIYDIYRRAGQILAQSEHAFPLEYFDLLNKAEYLADLYALDDIKLILLEQLKIYHEGRNAYIKCHNRNHELRNDYNENDWQFFQDKEDELIKNSDSLDVRRIFRNRLRIES